MMHFVNAISKMNEWLGKIAGYIGLLLLAVIIYDVVSAKVFNNPSLWSFDVEIFLFTVMVLIGAGYTQLVKGHVAVDIVSSRLPTKRKLILELVCYIVLALPFLVAFIWVTGVRAVESWAQSEASIGTSLFLPIYPFRALVPVGFFFLLLQVVCNIVVDLKELSGLHRSDQQENK